MTYAALSQDKTRVNAMGMVPLEHLLTQRDMTGKRCLLRIDLNVKDLHVGSQRLEQHGLVVRMLRDAGVKTLILSHMGRPAGMYDEALSLRKTVHIFAEKTLGFPVDFLAHPITEKEQTRRAFDGLPNGAVMVAENMRFYPGEKRNDQDFARYLASLGDFYVGDAFSVVHRAHATVAGLPELLPSFAGPSLLAELKNLTDTLYHSKRPLMVVFGGVKIATKLPALLHLIGHVDMIAVTGTLSCLLLAVQGRPIKIDVKLSLRRLAKEICDRVRAKKQPFLLPVDGVMVKKDGTRQTGPIDRMPHGAEMLDIGPRSCLQMINALEHVKTLIWNGPLGQYEKKPFSNGTRLFGKIVAARTKAEQLFTLVGGGDTDTALRTFGYHKEFHHISTGGGATLDWLAGRPLPGVLALEKCATLALSFLHKESQNSPKLQSNELLHNKLLRNELRRKEKAAV